MKDKEKKKANNRDFMRRKRESPIEAGTPPLTRAESGHLSHRRKKEHRGGIRVGKEKIIIPRSAGENRFHETYGTWPTETQLKKYLKYYGVDENLRRIKLKVSKQ
ncbi:MAG: hypothetical protein KGJ58_04520 [Patescibacteria group bacterium]|nr:hypothetical protein [Patescibacteria group bacterium]